MLLLDLPDGIEDREHVEVNTVKQRSEIPESVRYSCLRNITICILIAAALLVLPSCSDNPVSPDLRDNHDPTASAVSIIHDGSPCQGEELAGDYVFADQDGDDEGLSIYTWYGKAGFFDSYSVIAGAAGRNYTPSTPMFLKFSVCPVDQWGASGPEVASDEITVDSGT